MELTIHDFPAIIDPDGDSTNVIVMNADRSQVPEFMEAKDKQLKIYPQANDTGEY